EDRAPRSLASRCRGTCPRCTWRGADRRGGGRHRRSRRARHEDELAWRRLYRCDNRAMTTTVTPSREQILAFCAEDPVERVFLEDVARRGLGHFTAVQGGDGRLTALCHAAANIVPSGRGCGAFADAAQHGGARMLIGEEGAVGELWDAARGRF